MADTLCVERNRPSGVRGAARPGPRLAAPALSRDWNFKEAARQKAQRRELRTVWSGAERSRAELSRV